MNCNEVREQLAEHVLGTLDGPEDLGIRRHLRGCAACRREMGALGEGVSTFARAAHEFPPPEELKERVLTVLEQEWAEKPAARPVSRRVTRLAWVAAVIAVVGSVGWGVAANHRASGYEVAAGRYHAFLHALGGEAVRVGTLRPAGSQQMEGSVVLYDSDVGQSWALVLVRAPGMQGHARVTLSSPDGKTIPLHAIDFSQWGEGSTWLVTSSSLKPFDHVTIADAAGNALATATVR